MISANGRHCKRKRHSKCQKIKLRNLQKKSRFWFFFSSQNSDLNLRIHFLQISLSKKGVDQWRYQNSRVVNTFHRFKSSQTDSSVNQWEASNFHVLMSPPIGVNGIPRWARLQQIRVVPSVCDWAPATDGGGGWEKIQHKSIGVEELFGEPGPLLSDVCFLRNRINTFPTYSFWSKPPV